MPAGDAPLLFRGARRRHRPARTGAEAIPETRRRVTEPVPALVEP